MVDFIGTMVAAATFLALSMIMGEHSIKRAMHKMPERGAVGVFLKGPDRGFTWVFAGCSILLVGLMVLSVVAVSQGFWDK